MGRDGIDQSVVVASSMLHIEHAGDGKSLLLTYDIVLKDDRSAQDLTKAVGQQQGVSEVVLIASKSDVDY